MRTWVLGLAALVVAACGPGGPLMVETIQTGRAMNSDGSVSSHTSTFRPADTMYVSVLTDEPGAGTITVRWTYAGSVIHELSRQVSYYGQAATGFRFEAADAFPPGEYVIDVLVDGEVVDTRRVRVE